MVQKLQRTCRRVEMLSGRWDKKSRRDGKEVLKKIKYRLTYLRYSLKIKEATAYLESSRHEIEKFKEEIKLLEKQIDVYSYGTDSWKKWSRKPEFSDDTKEEFR